MFVDSCSLFVVCCVSVVVACRLLFTSYGVFCLWLAFSRIVAICACWLVICLWPSVGYLRRLVFVVCYMLLVVFGLCCVLFDVSRFGRWCYCLWFLVVVCVVSYVV